MRVFGFTRTAYFIAVCMFAFIDLLAQQADSILQRNLSEIEVVEKMRPSVTREGTPVQILDAKAIQRLGVQDLSEAVKRFSGVTVKDYGGIGGLKTVSVRSLGAQHTAVSYDGVSITDAQSGQVDISRFTLDNVETVSLSIGQADDIFKTARMYASAGALEIKTTSPVFKDKDYNLRTRVGGGSFGLFNPSLQYDRRLSKVFSSSLRTDWLSAKGEYPFTLSNGQLVTDERRKNSDIQSLRLEGNLYGDFGRSGKLKTKIYYYDSERGLPGSVILYNNRAKERLWDNNFFAQTHYEKSFAEALSFQASAKYNYSYNKYRDLNNAVEGGVREDRNTQQEYYASAGMLYRPVNNFSVTLTSDIAHNRLHNNYVNSAMPKRITSLSVLAAQYKTSRITTTGSLLGTYITDNVASGDKPADRKRLSPAVSISLRPFEDSSLRFRASFKDGFRVPTFTDMYYQRMGNTNLRPERATQYNAGITWSGYTDHLFRYIALSADAFYNKVEDKIVAIPNMYLWRMMNLGEVDIKGLDVNINSETPLTDKMSLLFTASYSYQEALDVTNRSNKNYKHQIPYTPKHSGVASLTFENLWVNLTYSATAVGERYALQQNVNENHIKGYIEQNISLNKTFSVNNASIRVQGEVLNIGNKTYDIIKYYPMPGRAWRLNMSLIF